METLLLDPPVIGKILHYLWFASGVELAVLWLLVTGGVLLLTLTYGPLRLLRRKLGGWAVVPAGLLLPVVVFVSSCQKEVAKPSIDWYSRAVQTVMAGTLVLILVELHHVNHPTELLADVRTAARATNAAPGFRLVSNESAATNLPPPTQGSQPLDVRIVGFREVREGAPGQLSHPTDVDFGWPSNRRLPVDTEDITARRR